MREYGFPVFSRIRTESHFLKLRKNEGNVALDAILDFADVSKMLYNICYIAYNKMLYNI